MALLKTFEIAIISTVSSSNPKSTSALVWNPPQTKDGNQQKIEVNEKILSKKKSKDKP